MADARHRPGIMRVLAFWLEFARQTLGNRRLSRIAHARLHAPGDLKVTGTEHLPAHGVFVVAANHNRPGLTLDTIAALMLAAGTARPDLADGWLLIAGRTSPA